MIVGGLLLGAVMTGAGAARKHGVVAAEKARLDQAQDALRRFYVVNGRYPCPAGWIYARGDTEFGREAERCRNDQFRVGEDPEKNGLSLSQTAQGEWVSAGVLPFRSLGVSDREAVDGGGYVISYAVTARLTDAARFDQRSGVIDVVAADGQSRVIPPASIQYVVWIAGANGNGAYSYEGGVRHPCDARLEDHVNCDGDGTFLDGERLFAQIDGVWRASFDDTLRYVQYDNELAEKSGVLFYFRGACGAGFREVADEKLTAIGPVLISEHRSGDETQGERILCFSGRYGVSMSLEWRGAREKAHCPQGWEVIGYRYASSSVEPTDLRRADAAGLFLVVCGR